MRSAIILAAIALSACQSEPSFDERYDTAQETIEAKAEELDAELQEAPTQGDEPPAKPAAE
ncbi:hypothetical protein [Erythrobacter sp. A6_0]|uniref:hypothetical protein n=1 Tax=Erythrobacter sp. A6_0 TaxID=2821089 RepID=UPI001ADD4E90|nr:hypothetical protein [Erythrobacter sp. A6_0]MBO9510818.1 hypothetical protein [Erythrobacter sp. A6_0]